MENVLITGISRGLGQALAEVFLQNDFKVYGVHRGPAPENFTHGHFIPVNADITDETCESAIRSALGAAPLQLLINNAGIGGRSSALQKVKTSDLHLLFDTHCAGVLRVTRACLPNLLAHADPTVININSRMGSVSGQYTDRYDHLEMTYEYRIAKAAQNMLAACIQHEYGGKLKVSQVHPGRIKTGTSQVDAVMEPREAALRIYFLWKENRLRPGAGIHDAETGDLYSW